MSKAILIAILSIMLFAFAMAESAPPVMVVSSFRETNFISRYEKNHSKGAQLLLDKKSIEELGACVQHAGEGGNRPCMSALKKFSPVVQLEVFNNSDTDFVLTSLGCAMTGYYPQQFKATRPFPSQPEKIEYLLYLTPDKQLLQKRTRDFSIEQADRIRLPGKSSTVIDIRLMIDPVAQKKISYDTVSFKRESTTRFDLLFQSTHNPNIKLKSASQEMLFIIL